MSLSLFFFSGYSPSSFLHNSSAFAIAWINKHKTLKIEELRDHLEKKYDVIYRSRESYYELLKAGGMSYHKNEKVNPKREELKKKLYERKEEIENGQLVVLMEDESHLLWGDVCGYVWGREGEAIEVEMTNERER